MILPTGFENYSRVELHSLFSSRNWENLPFHQRLRACQEVENRYAIENETSPCLVTYKQMEGPTCGVQINGTIYLNTSFLKEGVFISHDPFVPTNVYETRVPAANWTMLDTIYHEGTHGIQEQQDRMFATYIESEMDYDLYRIQGVEKEAYEKGAKHTLAAIDEVERYTGNIDPQKETYLESIEAESYENSLNNAIRNYNDPDIENTLQEVIISKDFDYNRDNTSESFQRISEMYDDYQYRKYLESYNIQSNSKAFYAQDQETGKYKATEEMKDDPGIQTDPSSAENHHNSEYSSYNASESTSEYSYNSDCSSDVRQSSETSSSYDSDYSSSSSGSSQSSESSYEM